MLNIRNLEALIEEYLHVVLVHDASVSLPGKLAEGQGRGSEATHQERHHETTAGAFFEHQRIRPKTLVSAPKAGVTFRVVSARGLCSPNHKDQA